MHVLLLSLRKILPVILLAGLLSGCSLFYPSQPAADATSSLLLELQTQDLPQVSEPDLIYFKMLDALSGWGLSTTAILRTFDGGRTWFELTPIAGLRLETVDQSSFFLDGDNAWVLAGSAGSQSTGSLYQTADGGQTWQVFSPPFEVAQLFFTDDQHGWALVITGVAAGSTAAEIYSTSDAGEHWKLIHQANDQSLNRSGQLPFSGSKNSLSFRDLQHGYLGGSVPAEGFVYLYESENGGITWQQSKLELPQSLQTSFLSFEAPVFFSPDQGKLVVHFEGPDGPGVQVFTTNNGGENWIATNPIPGDGQVDFVSMQSGRVWDGEDLYITNDGGQIWVYASPDLRPAGAVLHYQFVNVDVGFALVVEPGSSYRFYLSEDGGADWVRLP